MADLYSHRNGETELPTIEAWYWFEGRLDNREVGGPVKVNVPNEAFPTLIVSPRWIDGWIRSDELTGRWWGPIEAPK